MSTIQEITKHRENNTIKTLIVLVNDENPLPDVSFVGIVFPLIPVSRKLSLSGDFET
jgi:hypothetical protein